MDWSELRSGILDDPPRPGELVYLARTGSEYTWCVVIDPSQPPHATPGLAPPEAWMYYSWLRDSAAHPDAFFADLRAELESKTGGDDRYRWPLDDPWPHGRSGTEPSGPCGAGGPCEH